MPFSCKTLLEMSCATLMGPKYIASWSYCRLFAAGHSDFIKMNRFDSFMTCV